MKREQVRRYYLVSLLWVSAIFSVILSSTIVTDLVFVDFVHGNPNRTPENAVTMMGIFPVIFSTIASVGCFLVFGPPQLVQAVLHWSLVERYRSRSALFVLCLAPFIAVLTWYCWDYLTPTDFDFGFNEDPDWRPYQHGITVQRYLAALAYQLPVTLFSLVYYDPALVRASRRFLVISAILVGATIGVGWGLYTAEEQYRLIDHKVG